MIADIFVSFVVIIFFLRMCYLKEMDTQMRARFALEAEQAAAASDKVAPSFLPAPPLMASTLSRISKAASIMPANASAPAHIEKKKSSANLKVKSMVRACRKVIKRSRRASLTV